MKRNHWHNTRECMIHLTKQLNPSQYHLDASSQVVTHLSNGQCLFFKIQLYPANNKSITILHMCRFDPELTQRVPSTKYTHTSSSKWRLLVVIAIKALIAVLFEKCFNYKRLKAFWYIFSSFGRTIAGRFSVRSLARDLFSSNVSLSCQLCSPYRTGFPDGN